MLNKIFGQKESLLILMIRDRERIFADINDR